MQGESGSDRELLDAAALVGHLVPADTVHGFLAEHRGRLFGDEMFADLFPSRRGRPSVAADVIATVLVLQSLEGLSDRDALRALVTDIRWKVACGLALDDEGFHPTVLTLWRNKLRDSEAPERIFDAVRHVVADTGVLANKNRRALDSTLLDDAVATQDTVTQLVSMIGRVRKAVPAAAAAEVTAHDYTQPGKPACAWNDPEARKQLVSGLVNDALAVLAAVSGVELSETEEQLVALLALVAGQDVEPDPDGPQGSWRIAERVAKDRVISTVDPDSRHMHKSRSSYRDGFKAHIAIEPETGLITGCELTAANVGDGPVGVKLLRDEEPGLQILADSGYASGQVRADLQAAGHDAVIKPLPLGRNPKLDAGHFTPDDFFVDYDANTITCPQGQTVTINPTGRASFGKRCNGCPLRDRCTSSPDGKISRVSPHDRHLRQARTNWAAGIGAQDYRQHRPMVERSIAWLVAKGNRRVRYHGINRNHQQLSTRAAAINLRKLINLGLNHTPTGWELAA